MSHQPLDDQVAVVTGASRGIGKATAFALARLGAKVVLAARTKPEIEAHAQRIRSEGGQALAVRADVGKEREVLRLFERARAAFGPCDILINNAGLYPFQPVAEMPVETWDAVMNTNLRGVFLCTREALREMEPRGRGRIVNVASVRGLWTDGSTNRARGAAYETSKFGLMGFTEAVARGYRDRGISCSAICPGAVDVRGDPPRPDILSPDEVAECIAHIVTARALTNLYQLVVFPTRQDAWNG